MSYTEADGGGEVQGELFKIADDTRAKLDGWFNRQWMFLHVFMLCDPADVLKVANAFGVLCETVMDFDQRHFIKRCG